MDGEDIVGIVVAGIFAIWILAAMIYGLVHGRFRLGPRRFKTLPELVDTVSRTIGLAPEPGAYPELSRVAFKGRLVSGRQARVSFFEESAGSSTFTYVRLEVVASEAPDLKVSRETTMTRVHKWLGLQNEIEIGDPDFDRRYLLETKTPDRARKALARSHEVRRSIETAFAFNAKHVSFGAGIVSAVFAIEALAPEHYPSILGSLDEAARTFDRVTIKVRGLEGERRAAVDALGKTRCPYCRAGITGDDEALTACKACRTVLHEGCWDEHGGCPILGCTGRDPERATRRGRVPRA